MTYEPAATATPTTGRKAPKGVPRRRRNVLASEQTVDLSPVLAGVYIRVSTAREEMISPELQQRDVDTYLARMTAQTGRPWRAVAVEQDLDISGRSFARAGIQKLMEMMRAGTITVILTYRYDRFGRNLQQALDHLEEVEALGGQVVSVTEPIDATTAMGHYMRSQSLALADLQSRQIGEGWKRVHQYRVDRGLPTNGRERYGYLSHRTTHTRNDGALRLCPQGCAAGECVTGFVPDPHTGHIVQRLYREYIDGKGFQAIAHQLNGEGLPCPGVVAARRSGNPTRIARAGTAQWSAGSIIDLLDSGWAAGLVTHNGRWYPGAHEPLITEEQWQAYRSRRDAQRIVPTKARAPKWALAAIAVCGSCGGKMYCTSTPRGEQYALYCNTARASGSCDGTYRTRKPVEDAVFLWLQQYARELEQATRDALAQQPVKPKQDPVQAERRKLTKIVEAAEAKTSRLLDAYTDGAPGLDLPEYKRRRQAIQTDVDQAQARLAELDAAPTVAPTPREVTSLAQMWPTLSVDARRDVARTLIDKVLVHPNKSVVVVPRWGGPTTFLFRKRGSQPYRASLSDAQPA